MRGTCIHPVAGAAAAVFVMLCTTPASADVLAIGDDGVVTLYDRPMVYSDAGAAPVSQPQRRAPRTAQPQVGEAIARAASHYSLSADLLEAVAWQESRFRSAAVSPKGAVGVMQLMPATARALGVDPHDVVQNIHGGAAYLGQMLNRYGGNVELALAAYNAGPGAVDRYGGVPPYRETQAYVAAIMGRLSQVAAR